MECTNDSASSPSSVPKLNVFTQITDGSPADIVRQCLQPPEGPIALSHMKQASKNGQGECLIEVATSLFHLFPLTDSRFLPARSAFLRCCERSATPGPCQPQCASVTKWLPRIPRNRITNRYGGFFVGRVKSGIEKFSSSTMHAEVYAAQRRSARLNTKLGILIDFGPARPNCY